MTQVPVGWKIEIMTSPLITINSDLVSSVAVDMTLQNYVRHLLLVDSQNNANEPIGIITSLDFTRYQEFTDDDKEKYANWKDIRILHMKNIFIGLQ